MNLIIHPKMRKPLLCETDVSLYIYHLLFISFFITYLFAVDLSYNASITSKFGDNYNFYTYTENRFDLNIFYKDFQSWIQYEYSNPPDIGFSINDIRKFRIEYGHDYYTV